MYKFSTLCIAMMVVASYAFSQDVTALESYRYSKVVIVDVTQAWTATGVSVMAGDTVEVSVRGIASTEGATNPSFPGWYGPEGEGTSITPAYFNVPGIAGHSVIGKIGESGTGFYVGSGKVLVCNVSGPLYLGYNDDPSRAPWPENFGYYVAWIVAPSVIRPFTDVRGGPDVPKSISVSQNYPNPFNPATTIDFQMPGRSNVSIAIYNAAGQQVRTLLNEYRDAGTYSIVWDGK